MTVRVRKPLWARLKQAAAREHRAAHNQLLTFLEQRLDEEDRKEQEDR